MVGAGTATSWSCSAHGIQTPTPNRITTAKCKLHYIQIVEVIVCELTVFMEECGGLVELGGVSEPQVESRRHLAAHQGPVLLPGQHRVTTWGHGSRSHVTRLCLYRYSVDVPVPGHMNINGGSYTCRVPVMSAVETTYIPGKFRPVGAHIPEVALCKTLRILKVSLVCKTLRTLEGSLYRHPVSFITVSNVGTTRTLESSLRGQEGDDILQSQVGGRDTLLQ